MNDKIESTYKDARVLVTGGTGSVGVELVRALLDFKPKEIRVFSNDENGLFETRNLFDVTPEISYVLGDVRDKEAVNKAVDGCDVVFHAAALKHVNLCEENPYEAISTNIDGTQNLVHSTREHVVKRFVYVSTDKAVNPISVMGATKLLAERLVLNAHKANGSTRYSCVRFGNVIGSRGSVLRIFEQQIRNGAELTVTNPNMTRFVMLPSDASKMVVRAGALALSGETYVLEMRAVRIGELAGACIEFFAERYNRDPREIKLKKTGIRIGEKMHEELMSLPESARAIRRDGFFVIPLGAEHDNSVERIRGKKSGYSSNSVKLLSREQMVELLSEVYPPQARPLS